MYKKNLTSIIIPDYKDPYLGKTVESLLNNAQGEVEIVVVVDGCELVSKLPEDKRIKIVHLGKNRGMRGAINAGVLVSNGEFLMRVDEHQTFGPGYDVILTKECEENWIVTPRRFFLDPIKWEVMDLPYIDEMDLKIVGEPPKFSGVERKDKNNTMINESYAMQGSCWVMRHSWWDKVIGELDTETYGPLNFDSHEMIFKTWKAGGKLMVNKNTWHAHKHRSFSRTHSNGTAENPANTKRCFENSLKIWKDYFEELISNKKINRYEGLDNNFPNK